MTFLNYFSVLFFWMFSSIATTIVSPNLGTIDYKKSKSANGYSSALFELSWTVPGNETKRSAFMFLPGRALPTKIKYITIQNASDKLVSLSESDKALLAWAVEVMENDSVATAFLRLILNSPAVDSHYFKRTNETNIVADDGLIWAAGWYTHGHSLRYAVVPVGDIKTDCFGRKGEKCGSPKYSRAALNHDICHRIENQQLGVCADEFWDAFLSETNSDLLKTLF